MKTLTRTLLVLFFLVTAVTFSAQNRQIDSLENLSKTMPDDTLKVLMLDYLCVRYMNAGKLDKSVETAEKGILLARKLNYLRGEADIYNDLSNTYNFKGDYKKAIDYQNLAIPIRIQLKQQKKLGRSYNNIAAFYERSGDYAKSLEFNFKSLKIKEELNDSIGIVKANNNIGNLYFVTKNLKLASEYYNKAYELAQKVNNSDQLAMSLDHLSALYQELKDYNKALDYSRKSLDISIKSENRYMTVVNYSNLGTIYNNLNRAEEGVVYFLKALKMWEEDGDLDGIQSVCLALGQYYKTKGNYQEAINYFERCLRDNQHKRELSNAYKFLSELYALKKEFEKALAYSIKYTEIQQILYNEESAAKIAQMQTRYETEKKEKENNELKSKNQVQKLELQNEIEKRRNTIMLAVLSIVVIILIVVFLSKQKKLKHQAQLAEERNEQEKLRFKAIIDAEEKERARIAQELHDGLGQMLSATRLHIAALEGYVLSTEKAYVEKALKILDDACIEVRNISHNMMPGALIRLGLIPAIQELVSNINSARTLKIDFSTNVSQSLGKSIDISIYRIVQEVLNNMIKHARADHISMDISHEEDSLKINIRDNGVGFDTNVLKETKGLGWKGIFSRVSMLDGTIELNSKLKEGTIIFINLKLKKRD